MRVISSLRSRGFVLGSPSPPLTWLRLALMAALSLASFSCLLEFSSAYLKLASASKVALLLFWSICMGSPSRLV